MTRRHILGIAYIRVLGAAAYAAAAAAAHAALADLHRQQADSSAV